jgi:DNA polymerase-3 subunit epsilon
VLRASLREAARLDLRLPLMDCPPRQDARFTPQPPKVPCAFRNPGRLAPGGPLIQGMKIALTGQTATSRPELVLRAADAGLPIRVPAARDPREPAPAPAPVRAVPVRTLPSRTPDRPLAGRRVLVLGGTHPEAVAARSRVVELGGAAAINLSASVTDVVLLAGGDADRRMRRIVPLGLPTHVAG